MKQYIVYFCLVVFSSIQSMEYTPMSDDEMAQASKNLSAFIKILDSTIFEAKSLQQLCIDYILAHPREYIEHNAEQVLNDDTHDSIRDIAYNREVRRKLLQEEYPSRIKNPSMYYSENGFLSNRIPLAQILLRRTAFIAERNEKKLELTKKEKEIFNGMLPQHQEEIKPHIKKSFWQELYELCCT